MSHHSSKKHSKSQIIISTLACLCGQTMFAAFLIIKFNVEALRAITDDTPPYLWATLISVVCITCFSTTTVITSLRGLQGRSLLTATGHMEANLSLLGATLGASALAFIGEDVITREYASVWPFLLAILGLLVGIVAFCILLAVLLFSCEPEPKTRTHQSALGRPRISD